MDAPVAVVTGGCSGLGRATARRLADDGWRVVVGDVDVTDGETEQDGVTTVHLDVARRAEVERVIDETAARLGRLDLLVNNAGINKVAPLEDLSVEDWHLVLDVDLHGAFHCLQAAGRHMLAAGSGSIVNVVSVAASRGVVGRTAFAVAKAGLVALTRSAAVEWAARGIRVNAIAPGFMETEGVQLAIERGIVDLDTAMARTPMRRMGQPVDIANAVRFLSSPDASYITGHVLYVDGGFIADYGVPPTRAAEATARN